MLLLPLPISRGVTGWRVVVGGQFNFPSHCCSDYSFDTEHGQFSTPSWGRGLACLVSDQAFTTACCLCVRLSRRLSVVWCSYAGPVCRELLPKLCVGGAGLGSLTPAWYVPATLTALYRPLSWVQTSRWETSSQCHLQYEYNNTTNTTNTDNIITR